MSEFGPFPTDPNTSGSFAQRQPPTSEPDWITSLSDSIEKSLSSLCSSRLKSFIALMLFALVCFLPGFNSIPPVDRDEARFAQATKQMMETGDFIDIRFQEGTRYKKPVGIYWLQALSAEATGMGAKAPIWAYRIPSLAGALLAVGFTFLLGMKMSSVRVGFSGRNGHGSRDPARRRGPSCQDRRHVALRPSWRCSGFCGNCMKTARASRAPRPSSFGARSDWVS